MPWKALAALALLALTGLARAEFTVQPERNPVPPNSTFELELKGEGDFDGSPDVEPLKEQFNILSRSQSSQTRCVNFDCTTAKIITLRVMPKNRGDITIPALSWNGRQSEPVTLRVEEQAAGSSPVTVELLVDQDAPYVQEQVILTLRARSRQRYARGQFSGFNLPDDVIVRAIDDEPNHYTSQFNNIPQQVVEQRFALFPQKSGELTLPPVQFQAQFPSGQRDMFGQRQYSLRQFSSKPRTLEVRSRPDNAPTPWLPARQLSVSHYLSEEKHQVGQPITLSISSMGDGVLASQLPEVKLPEIDGLKIYPDSPQTEARASEGSVTAKRVDKIALIPTRPGSYTVPEMTFNWWNTESDSAEQVTLGPIELTVEGSAAAGASQNGSNELKGAESGDSADKGTASPASDTDGDASSPTDSSADKSVDSGESRLWQGLALLFLILWLLTLVVFLWRSKRRSPRHAEPAPAPSADTLDLETLKSRMRQGLEAREAADLIARWGRQLPGKPAGLHAIARAIEADQPPLAGEIARLHRHLYAGDDQPWQSKALSAALDGLAASDFANTGGGTTRRKHLPPLY
ncbi:MAG: BatD family protein [Pseudomonadota bacterium]